MAGKLLIVEPMAIAAMTSSNGADPSPFALTQTYDPKEAWSAVSTTTRQLRIDMGDVVTVDSFFVGYHNASAVNTAGLVKMDDMAGTNAVALQGGTLLRPADCKTVRAHYFRRLAAPATSRYFRINFGANDVPLQIGSVALGLAFEAEWDREWGSGRRPIDTGKATQLIGGGFGVQDGVRKAAYNFTFGDLTDAEVETLWGIFIRRGTTQPVIVHERDGTAVGSSEAVHYGLFQRLDVFERREPAATKWAMEVEEWV